jgi:high-affinity Fe2+/Pb2+ permease
VADFDMIYLLAGAALIAIIVIGAWQIRGRRRVRLAPRSAVSEAEEARRKIQQ